MEKFWNDLQAKPMLQYLCELLNGFYSDVAFRPEQYLKNEEDLSVSATGVLQRETAFCDGLCRWKKEYQIFCPAAGGGPQNRYDACALLETLADRLQECSFMQLPSGYRYAGFTVSESPRLYLRETNGDDVYSMKIFLRFLKKGAVV